MQETAGTETADADLVLRTRSGDTEAFGELWRRHYPSGIAVARSITSSLDSDDLVQEAYARIYQAILKGGGPNGSFRAYLFTSIRNTAAAWGRARRETAIDELDHVADPGSTDQATEEALDRGLTAQAFRSLPSRWQEVLWYSEIEQMKPAAIAPLLGMSAGAVSQLAFRAREGLREAWIGAHLRSAEPGSDCQWTVENLGAYSRNNLSARDKKRLDAHLGECARCMIVAAEAEEVSSKLALVLLPLLLGATGATGYLATLQQGAAPVVAMAAMPSSVTEGVVVAGGSAVAGGAGVGAGAGGSAGSSGAAGGTGTSAGVFIGAGAAAFVVAAAAAAATLAPGILQGAPATSKPSAADSMSQSIDSEVAPDESAFSKSPLVIEEEAPEDPPVADDDEPAKPAEEPEEAMPAPEPTSSNSDEAAPMPEPKPTAPDDGDDDEQPVPPDDDDDSPAPAGKPTIGKASFDRLEDQVAYWSVPLTGEPNARVGVTIDDAADEGVRAASASEPLRTVLDENGEGEITIPFTTESRLDDKLTFRYLNDGDGPDGKPEVVTWWQLGLKWFDFPQRPSAGAPSDAEQGDPTQEEASDAPTEESADAEAPAEGETLKQAEAEDASAARELPESTEENEDAVATEDD